VILFLPSSTLVKHNSKERGRRRDRRRSRHQRLSTADCPKEASTMLCSGDGQTRNQAMSWHRS
jgi:hypothetical protein